MNSSIYNSKNKKYWWGFFWFLLFIFIFDRGLFLIIKSLEKKIYSENNFEDRFSRYVTDKNFTTLIFGTSRSYEGIHPIYLEKGLNQKVFKETFQGKGPKYNYYFYQLYKKYAGVPRVVIYGVDYFIYSITSDPKWMARFDIEHSKINHFLFSAPLLLIKNKKKIDNFYNNLLIHWQSENKVTKKDLFKDFSDMHNYKGAHFPEEKKNIVSKVKGKYKRQWFIRFPGEEGNYFIKLLEQLNNDNVVVILVGLPDYFGSFKTNFQRWKFARHLRRLEEKYKNVYFFNYNRPSKFPLKAKEYFLDGGYGRTNSHLSMEGAKVFNELLVKDIKKYFK